MERRVAYIVREQEVYFAGIDGFGATINMAEEVIKSICAQEDIRWQDYTFYDIQTHAGGAEETISTSGYGEATNDFIVQRWIVPRPFLPFSGKYFSELDSSLFNRQIITSFEKKLDKEDIKDP